MSLLKKIVIVLLFAAAISAAAYYVPQLTFSQELKVSGVVEIQEVRLGSKVGGRVSGIFVREGEIVEPRQVLVEFETPELEAQYKQQVSRVAQARANLEKARNGFRAEEIREARSELESLQADLAFAEQEFVRIEALYKDKKLTRGDFDTAVAVRNRMQGRVAAAQARYDLLSAGTRAEDIALAEANLQEAQGKLEELEAQLAEAKVVAPERCLIEVVSVRKGDLVPPHQPVVRVLRADDVWVKVYVPETRLGEVRLGQEVEVTIDSYPGRKFRGTVYHIAGESEFTPRNIQSIDERRYQVFGLKIRVDDTEGIFKSGMSASVTFNGPVPTDGPAARLSERSP